MTYDPAYTEAWYDKLGEGEWDRWDRSPATQMQEAVFLHHLKAAVAKGDRVLDVGCGAGRYTRRLIELGADVTAFDLSKGQLDLCRERAPGAVDYALGTVTDLSRYADDSFDVTVCIGGAISYTFERDHEAMAELARVTAPGGRVVLSVMGLFGTVHVALESILTGEAALNERVFETGTVLRTENVGHECKMYRVDQLREMMARAGLEAVALSAPGFLTTVHPNLELPPVGSAQYNWLLKAEIAASAENPGAGNHIIGTGLIPTAANSHG